MIRITSCQLCLNAATNLVLSRHFSTTVQKLKKLNPATKVLTESQFIAPEKKKPRKKKDAKILNILKTPVTEAASHPRQGEANTVNANSRVTIAVPVPFLNIKDVSDAPVKLINAVDPKVLRQAVINSHKLDYSKLPQYYLGLSKFRLTGLVVITAMAGYAMAPAAFHLLPFISLTLGTALTSASANTINQIMEVEYDAQMDRTKNRVLVRRNLSFTHAKLFAAATGIGGVSILMFGANELTALLGSLNLALYTCVYTPLKRKTIANTWIGSIVGGIPPVMGWAACTGELSHGALLLGGILYAWQFPHFNALSWNLRKDYNKAGYKMMAISHPELCKKTSLRYSAGIIAMSSLAPVCDVTSWTFVVDSLPVNGYLAYLAYKFYKDGDSSSSRKLFRYTLIHLPVLIILMMISKKNYEKDCTKPEILTSSPIERLPSAVLGIQDSVIIK